jgi:type I restriction enzyme S subunit
MSFKWHSSTLGELTDWYSGGTPSKKKPEFWGGEIPWISASSMRGARYSASDLKITLEGLKAGSRLAACGSILLLVRGSTLHQRIPVGIAVTDVAFNQDVKAISAKPDLVDNQVIDSWYLFYWLKANESRLLSMVESTGIGAGKLDTKQLQGLRVDYPDWEEQRRIVACCKAVEEKEIVNHQINQTLEQMAQAIFKSWFVDFEPVKAKIAALDAGGTEEDALLAAMQVISGKDTDQLAQMQAEQPERYAELRATAELFPSAMQDSELGDIPEGWGVAPIGQLCDVRKGLSYKGKHVVDDETQFPMINLGNFGGAGAFKAEKLKRYDGDHKPRHMVSAGQLMVANTDMTQNRVILGSPIIVPDVGTTILFTHHTFAVDFKPEYPAAEWRNYIFHWCLQPSFRGRAEGFATGTTVLALPKDAFLKCDIVVAPHNVVGTFNSKAQSIIAEQDSLNAQNSSLEELRNTLLPKLLSGELTLPDTKETQTELQDVADV